MKIIILQAAAAAVLTYAAVVIQSGVAAYLHHDVVAPVRA